MQMPPLLDLAVFMGLVLAFALFGLTASGHFPAEHRGDGLRSGLGAALLWMSIAGACVVLVAAVLLAMRLPLYASVIGGGAMLLVAPLVLQGFPDRFVDGRVGLITFSGLGLCLVAASRLVGA